MEISSAASGNDAGKKRPPALSRTDAVAMCALTLLFAWLTARRLHLSAPIDDGEAFYAVLWRLSPPITAYLFFWTIALSGAAGAGAVLVRTTSLPLLAAATNRLIAPRGGAAVMFLATVYSASASGRALADRRRRAGTERTAAAAAACAPSYASRAEVESERQSRAAVVCCSVSIAIMVAMVISSVLWFTPEEGDDGGSHAGEVGLAVLMFLAGPWLVVTWQLMLNGSPLQADTDTLELVMPLGFISLLLVAISASVFFDMIVAVFVLWAEALVMAWFFGYGLAVEAHYMELVAIKRREPRTAKDASGLLDGRDKEDACFAHIDTAAGRCIECVLPGPSRCTC